MKPILAGIETEYGFAAAGRGADSQIEDATALVRGYPGAAWVGWDYRPESPRADVRGFKVERLSVDPVDAQFDRGRTHPADVEVRSDRVLPNGGRFYNDHGHPEVATPECWSLDELALQDRAGELAVLAAAREAAARFGREIAVYKNNTDFHGASYGTHESYLVARELGYERIFAAVLPVLVARIVLCGAGKVGSEAGERVAYQASQRADFFTEVASVDTLYRRPIFNTRDEPHADPRRHIRLHVIAGDANMIPGATRRKVALVKIALHLAALGEAPEWRISDPVAAAKAVSRGLSPDARIELQGSWTTPASILETLLAAGERFLDLRALGLAEQAMESRRLIEDLRDCPDRARRSIDWLAKRHVLELAADEIGGDQAAMQAYDLAYHDVDPEKGLYHALAAMGEVEEEPEGSVAAARLERPFEPTRALARSAAVRRLSDRLVGATWGSVAFEVEGRRQEIELDPEMTFPAELEHVENVTQFVDLVRSAQ